MKVAKITKRNGTVATVAPAGTHKKGQKVCKICHTPGHIAKTCPKGNSRGTMSAGARLGQQAESSLSDELKDRIRDMRDHEMTTTEIAEKLAIELDWDVEETKKEVERVMSRHASRVIEQKAGAAIGPDRFKAIRDAMHGRDFSSAAYALTNKLSPKEVNAAVRSTDYTNYLDIRV